MKFRTPELFLGVLLAVAIFAMGMLFAASYHPSPATINQNQPTESDARKQLAPAPNGIPKVLIGSHDVKCDGQCPNAEQEETEFWPPFYGYRLKVTDTLVAAFTALLFLATLAL